jgi:hypothetical protein
VKETGGAEMKKMFIEALVVLLAVSPLNCLVRNPYYNIEYWGP